MPINPNWSSLLHSAEEMVAISTPPGGRNESYWERGKRETHGQSPVGSGFSFTGMRAVSIRFGQRVN
jgi:hypothetical protein